MLPVHHNLAPVGGRLAQVTAVSDPLESDLLTPTIYYPLVGIKFLATGEIQEATGDTSATLSYSTVGYWVSRTAGLDGSKWEINFTVDSEDTGAAGTWTGSTRGSYIDLSVDRTFVWQKDTTAVGNANSEVTVTVRNIVNTSNSASKSNVSYNASVSA